LSGYGRFHEGLTLRKGLFIMKAIAIGAALLSLAATSVVAQDAAMKTCGDKWQAAKAAGATGGLTWPKFLAECRAGLAGAPTAAPVAPVAKPVVDPPVAGAKVVGPVVFPTSVSPKFADLRASQARQKTCSEQYQANKASGGNGGLNWLEKGGGYWSLCNKKLKGA
jgi:hypothetical protein